MSFVRQLSKRLSNKRKRLAIPNQYATVKTRCQLEASGVEYLNKTFILFHSCFRSFIPELNERELLLE